MGSVVFSDITCKNCNHKHHGDNLCTQYDFLNFPSCGCAKRNFMKDYMLYDVCPLVGLTYYSDVRCDKCTSQCSCSKCTCMKCINKKNNNASNSKNEKIQKSKNPYIV